MASFIGIALIILGIFFVANIVMTIAMNQMDQMDQPTGGTDKSTQKKKNLRSV